MNVLAAFKATNLTFLSILLVAGCSGPWPGLDADTSGLKRGRISDVLRKEWMMSDKSLKESLVGEIRSYMSDKKCSDTECLVGFGFDKCESKNKKLECDYDGEIIMVHDERAKVKDHVQSMKIKIHAVILSKDSVYVSLSRNGSGLSF